MRGAKEDEPSKKLKKYLAVTASLLLLALLSFLTVPQGSSVSSCRNLLIANSRYACLAALALASTNSSVCGYLGGTYADSCYAQVAQKSSNSTTCASIQDSGVRNSCVVGVATARLSYSVCYGATEPYTSRCLDAVALKTSNLSICSGIANSTYKVACGSEINMQYAVSKNAPAYCKNVTNYPDKNLTNYIIVNFTASSSTATSGSNLFSSSIAFLPNVTYTARDYCYTTLAAQLTNNAICANVTAGQAKNLCVIQSTKYSLTNATSNYTALLSSCPQSGSYAQQCIQAISLTQAVKTKNASICGKLAYSTGITCYSLLASTYANATYCNYIANATQRNTCISSS